MPVAEALALTSRELLDALGGLPLGRGHCARLATEALANALADAHARQARQRG